MVSIPVSVGEMIDKLSILQVKKLKVNDENKLEYLYDISLIKEKINLIQKLGTYIDY